ncbi:DNA-directed RNA polymerase [Rhodoblastus acidophilus]|uniref:DNA-directed RNA polymerase n=1 Tax=Rhodoblastus acidophilus TaxID=1074 RepID=UPI002224D9D2|nr:DNA-directed RNA polymerase [Rhodoblastus acidophilus]MCW2317100.1 DNA-directed RNA polymerase [Rhodoblastus acidophilus]
MSARSAAHSYSILDPDITAHPLWSLEVELERGMLAEGADNFRDRVVEAGEAKEMTRLSPVRHLMEDWLPGVVLGLKEWVRVSKASRGAKPLALQYLSDPKVQPAACLITVRTILDLITLERPALVPLFVRIGREIEHELKVRLWENQEPDLFYAQQKKFKVAHSDATHQRRVNINRFNSLLAEGNFGFGWEAWAEETCFHVGRELVDNLVRVTRWFDYIPDPDTVPRKGGIKAALILAPKPELVEWVGEALNRAEVLSPAFKPTVIPPKRWTGTKGGGYYTPYVNTPSLIRFKAHQKQMQEGAAQEYDALHMPMVYEAIHFVQETPWRVNKSVLEVAKQIIAKDLGIAGLPVMKARDLPPKPADIETNEEAKRRWKREAAAVYSSNARQLSKTRLASRTLRIAMEYAEFDRFYFPHMLDFRGRMYPIPVGLNPQGDALARGLLTFADGKPITEENGGAGWLAVHLGSCWGGTVDKMPFDTRIAWVEERADLWKAIAADPMGNLEWASTDKPFECLAAIFEWVQFLAVGWGYVSHLPIHVDGTCNGIQHLSAMTRDEVAGAYVNLTPSGKPQDIYKFVADALQEVLERIEETGVGLPAEHASFWLNLCGRDLPRSLTKRPVMVLPYGGTKDAYFKYTRLWLDEKAPLPTHATDQERTLRTQRLSFIVNHLWDVVNDRIKGGKAVMKWLKDCASVVAAQGQPLVWVTSSGFVVRHFYGKLKVKQINTRLDGQRVQLQIAETTKDLDKHAQLLGISPNFVHSQDAAALTMSIVKAKQKEVGITAFTAIHDAYGTHASDMWELSRCLREAFVELHSEDALASYRNACLAVLVDKLVADAGVDPMEAAQIADEKLPPMLAKGNLDLSSVKESEYFFA